MNFKSVLPNPSEDFIKENDKDFKSEKFSHLKKNLQTARKVPHIKIFTLNMNVINFLTNIIYQLIIIERSQEE